MNGYPIYRRRNNQLFVLKKVGRQDILLDNRHVVPHNKALLLKYQSHINVEVCSNVKAIKYIYKYIFKGDDRANVQTEFNEIKSYYKHVTFRHPKLVGEYLHLKLILQAILFIV